MSLDCNQLSCAEAHGWFDLLILSNSFKVKHFINTFSLENEICCPNSFRIRQYIDTIAMLYSLACCINQIVEIITLFANRTINISFTLYKTKFTIIDNQLQLLNKSGAL